jgi:hypothetical protein
LSLAWPTLIILNDVLEWGGHELTASVTGWVEGMFAADASGTAAFQKGRAPTGSCSAKSTPRSAPVASVVLSS